MRPWSSIVTDLPGRSDKPILRRFAQTSRRADLLEAVDSLTGCLNHAGFQTRLRAEVSRAERGADRFTLVLLDLDGFRLVNERYGHLAGDTVLRGVGEILRRELSPADEVARVGGDEFALLLGGADGARARATVDRVLARLTETPLAEDLLIAAGAGLATYAEGDQAAGLIERAEAALREAKRARGAAAAPAIGRPDQRTHRLALAGELGARLSGLLDPEEIVRTAERDMRAVLGYEHCAIVRRQDAPEGGPLARCLAERRAVQASGAAGPVMVLPLVAGEKLWGAIEVVAPGATSFDLSDARLVRTVADQVGAALLTAGLYRELEETYVGTAAALAAALEAKDDYTADHAESIAKLAVQVGEELGMDPRALRDLRYGAIFHDIGKIAVPDAILHKPGRLTDDEFEVVKRHPVTGEQILAPVPFLAEVRRIVRHDHERWDGTGYPDGLRGPEIPIGARIVLVVDAFHAITSNRPYRQGLPESEARRRLREGAGTQFDPDVVEAFLRVLDRVAA